MPRRRRQKSALPELRLDVLQAVVAGVAAAELELHLARQQVEFVVHDEDLVRLDLEEARQRRDRLARQVHERHRLQQPERPGRRGSRARPARSSCARAASVTAACAATASIHQKPALCRVASYSGPGLPRPTSSRIMVRIIGWARPRKKPHRGGACRMACEAEAPHFLFCFSFFFGLGGLPASGAATTTACRRGLFLDRRQRDGDDHRVRLAVRHDLDAVGQLEVVDVQRWPLASSPGRWS